MVLPHTWHTDMLKNHAGTAAELHKAFFAAVIDRAPRRDRLLVATPNATGDKYRLDKLEAWRNRELRESGPALVEKIAKENSAQIEKYQWFLRTGIERLGDRLDGLPKHEEATLRLFNSRVDLTEEQVNTIATAVAVLHGGLSTADRARPKRELKDMLLGCVSTAREKFSDRNSAKDHLNNFYDIHYVALGSDLSGLLSNDKRLLTFYRVYCKAKSLIWGLA